MLHNAHQRNIDELEEVFKSLGLPGRQKTSLTLAEFYSKTPEPPQDEPASAINGADSITTDSKLLDDIKYGSSTKPALHKGIASKNNQQPREIPCTKADTRTSTPNKTSPRQTDDPKVLDSTRRGPPCKANKPILTNTSILLKQKIDAKPVKSNSTINLRTTVQVSSAVFEQFEMPKSSTFISKSKLAFLPVQQVTGTPRQMENKTFRKTVTEKNGLYQPAFVALQRSHLRRQNTLSLPSLSQAASRSLSMEEPRDLLKTFSDPGERQVTWYQPKRQLHRFHRPSLQFDVTCGRPILDPSTAQWAMGHVSLTHEANES
ncbi:hypothetical protein CAPTEDRAFT_194501 [Capitella teleta]|uniref:Uncharacterized protein n=1 Tax=Capitella teleta TaxID=283909 RepID=R7TDL3_CAPTE|nr:hypothetical protein CAPTEDRAFT_194501 [Capitella teleta]|eukprot:ELT89161.1 hypothetical protein CAPTEDRAFT_194501 [Capitella teleta]